MVVSDLPPFIVFALTPLWPTTGFLLDFEEGIHVIDRVLQFSFSDRTVPFHRNATLHRCVELHVLSPMLSSIRP